MPLSIQKCIGWLCVGIASPLLYKSKSLTNYEFNAKLLKTISVPLYNLHYLNEAYYVHVQIVNRCMSGGANYVAHIYLHVALCGGQEKQG